VKNVIVDTGPLVAFLNARDKHHRWARDVLGGVEPPLRTCEAVISEACFLVRGLRGGPDAVLALVVRGAVEVPFRLDGELIAVRKLMARYADVPMSLADGCLVRMSELEPRSTVLTLDADFRVYRRHGRQLIALLAPS
jgi:predicted nucleic acid-binding protein